jgi:presenilin-like A22 family membrane protease
MKTRYILTPSLTLVLIGILLLKYTGWFIIPALLIFIGASITAVIGMLTFIEQELEF